MRSAHKKSEGLGSNVWPPLAQPGPAGPKWKSIPTCLTFCYGTGNALRFSFGSDPCHNCHCQKMGFSSEMSSPAAVSGGRHTTGGDTLQSPRPAVWRVRPQCVGSTAFVKDNDGFPPTTCGNDVSVDAGFRRNDSVYEL